MTAFIRRLPRSLRDPRWSLFFVGAASLYWELVLIRWLSAWIRIVAYYTNFVLIAAFFGLGLGALLVRFRFRLQTLLAPLVSFTLLAGLFLAHYSFSNPSSMHEYLWLGGPVGVAVEDSLAAGAHSLPMLLGFLYLLVASVFACFGQWLGQLFTTLPPLKAYAIEIMGSIFGILLFALLAFFQLTPLLWISVGFVLLAVAFAGYKLRQLIVFICAGAVLILAARPVENYLWSPYYKIKVTALTEIHDIRDGPSLRLNPSAGYSLEVNNDYHQMMLDLHPRADDHPFFSGWRNLYDAPYPIAKDLPDGPILVIGAGTGNDVMAALRNTGRPIVAVDIDPAIVAIGRRLHPEHPYQNPRVTVVIDDARSYMQKTPQRFALVVFGFLDSHTLFSAFSSLRLDNFVYTRESFQRVKQILLPGGEVVVTFASNQPWIHERLLALMSEVFDAPTQFRFPPPPAYANGVVYRNFKSPLPPGIHSEKKPASQITVPTDDWPFLYLETPMIPRHYTPFLVIVIGLGFLSLLVLPRGEKKIHLPFFFMGAAFFLLETSNVVTLSLLFGSTWIVNVVVFLGILLLVLAGTLAADRAAGMPLTPIFLALFGSLAVGWVTPVAFLLPIESTLLRAMSASVIFLGPVFFASLIFAGLLRHEKQLAPAYGSNLLGAVVGGACEYQSLAFGFHHLLKLIILFYLLSFWFATRTAASNK